MRAIPLVVFLLVIITPVYSLTESFPTRSLIKNWIEKGLVSFEASPFEGNIYFECVPEQPMFVISGCECSVHELSSTGNIIDCPCKDYYINFDTESDLLSYFEDLQCGDGNIRLMFDLFNQEYYIRIIFPECGSATIVQIQGVFLKELY